MSDTEKEVREMIHDLLFEVQYAEIGNKAQKRREAVDLLMEALKRHKA